MKNPQFKRLLANKNFLKLWASQMLSQFTIQIMNFYILTRIFSLTGSTVAVSMMWLASALPALLFGPFSGAIVDSFSRRKIMIIATFMQASTVAMVLFASNNVFNLYVIVFFYWLFEQFYFPSQQASAPTLVKRELLTEAIGLFLLTQQASILIGFGLGGVLLSVIGSTPTIIFASACLFFASFAVYLLPHDVPRKVLFEKGLSQFWNDFISGYRFIKSNRVVGAGFMLVVCTQVFITIISTTLPTFTDRVLGLGLHQASPVLILPGVLAAIATTYYLPRFTKTRRKKELIETGLLIGGVSMLLMGGISFLPHLVRLILASVSAVGMGIAAAIITVPAQLLMQEKTPDWLRGRIYGQMGFVLILSTTLPLLLSAALADLLGITTLLIIMGLILLIGRWFIRHTAHHVLANSTRV